MNSVAFIFIMVIMCCQSLSWFDLIWLSDLESLSLYCEKGYNGNFVAIPDNDSFPPETIKLQLDLEYQIAGHFLFVTRIYFVDWMDMNRLWSGHYGINDAISIDSEIQSLLHMKSTYLDMHDWEDTSEKEKHQLKDLCHAIDIVSEILSTVCFSQKHSDEILSTVLSIASYPTLTSSVRSLVSHYVNTTLVPLISSSSSCLLYLHPPAPITIFDTESKGNSPVSDDIVIKVTDTDISYRDMFPYYIRENSYIILRQLYIFFLDPTMHQSDAPMTSQYMWCHSSRNITEEESMSPSNNDIAVNELFYDPLLATCTPIRDTLNTLYHTTIGVVAMSMSKALAAHTPSLQEHKLSLLFSEDCESPLRMLSLGLGGGELHGALLERFPCIGVDSVEIESVVIEVAQSHFHLGVCEVTDNMLPVTNSVTTSTTCASDEDCKSGSARSVPGNHITGDACRSRVFQYDARAFVREAAERGDLTWAFVVLDVFNASFTQWEGYPGEGLSNIVVDREELRFMLTAVRDITDPTVGLVILHLHKDSMYEVYMNVVNSLFESVIHVNVDENEGVIIASRYAGLGVLGAISASESVTNEEQDDWLCGDPHGSAEAIVDFARKHGYGVREAMSLRYAVRGMNLI